jgi:hypothetical protein
MKSWFVRGGTALLLIAVATTSAAAQDTTVCFVGTVRSTSGAPFDGITPEVPVRGQYTFNPQTPATVLADNIYEYMHSTPGHGMKLRIGRYLFQTDPMAPSFAIQIFNDFNERDHFLTFSQRNVASNGMHPESIVMQLDDATRENLSSMTLPATAPRAGAWTQEFGLVIFGRNGGYEIRSEVSAFAIGSDCGVEEPFSGIPGPQGPQGERGPEGPAGAQGVEGAQGIQGEKGDAGERGPQGPSGEKGEKGDKGDAGERGPQGVTGDKGDTGARGEKGDKGEGLVTGSMLILPEGTPGPAGYILLDTFDFSFSDRSRGRRQMLRVDVWQRLDETPQQ